MSQSRRHARCLDARRHHSPWHATGLSEFELGLFVTSIGIALAPDAVDVEVHACSLGYSDVQQLRGEWGTCLLPLVPGREALGTVVAMGSSVKGIEPGQRVAVLLGSGMDSENDEDGADRSTRRWAPGATKDTSTGLLPVAIIDPAHRPGMQVAMHVCANGGW